MVLRRFRAKWLRDFEAQQRAVAEGRLNCGNRPPGRFVNDWIDDRTELRLFCLGYPELAKAWAEPAALTPSTPSWELRRAVFALGYLAEARFGDSENALMKLCRHPDEYIKEVAVWRLSVLDSSGRHLKLFQELAREGVQAAMEALSFTDDPETRAILKEAGTRWRNLPYPKGTFYLLVQEVQPRLDSFVAGQWEARAKKAVLEEPGPRMRGDIAWALQLGRDRRPAWFEATLRKRLRATTEAGGATLYPPRFEVQDDAFDDVLLALARIGGELSSEESAYLKRFGYACEPRARLGEILEEKRYPPF